MNIEDLLFDLASKAIDLIQRESTLKDEDDRLDWTMDAMSLLGEYTDAQEQAVAPVMLDPSVDESSPDYQFLQQVINSSIPDMRDPEIGERLKNIANSENTSLIPFLKKAIASYRDAMTAMASQFLSNWGNA